MTTKKQNYKPMVTIKDTIKENIPLLKSLWNDKKLSDAELDTLQQFLFLSQQAVKKQWLAD